MASCHTCGCDEPSAMQGFTMFHLFHLVKQGMSPWPYRQLMKKVFTVWGTEARLETKNHLEDISSSFAIIPSGFHCTEESTSPVQQRFAAEYIPCWALATGNLALDVPPTYWKFGRLTCSTLKRLTRLFDGLVKTQCHLNWRCHLWPEGTAVWICLLFGKGQWNFLRLLSFSCDKDSQSQEATAGAPAQWLSASPLTYPYRNTQSLFNLQKTGCENTSQSAGKQDLFTAVRPGQFQHIPEGPEVKASAEQRQWNWFDSSNNLANFSFQKLSSLRHFAGASSPGELKAFRCLGTKQVEKE